MKKFIFGIVAIIVVGIIAVSLPKQDKEEDSLLVNAAKETIEDDDGFYTEPMSDKDIYFKADTVLPDNPVINDMMDIANGYAILRAAYCDAELWFRFGMVVNNEISRLKTGTIKDADTRIAAEQYVRKLVLIMPVDTTKRNETDSLLWDQVWDAYIYTINDFCFLATYDNITRYRWVLLIPTVCVGIDGVLSPNHRSALPLA